MKTEGWSWAQVQKLEKGRQHWQSLMAALCTSQRLEDY